MAELVLVADRNGVIIRVETARLGHGGLLSCCGVRRQADVVSEPRLDFRAGRRQGCVQSQLVDRPGDDPLAAGLPFGDHAFADAEVACEVADAHALGLAQCADFAA
jgi:hypothetical protein